MTEQEKKEGLIKRNLIKIVLLLVVFLLGLSITGWQWWKSSSENEAIRIKLAETTKNLQREKIKGLLTTSIVEVERGEYGLAFNDSSRFFSTLRDEIDKEEESAYLLEEKLKLKPIFSSRDITIASIAKGEKDSAKLLINIYLAYRNAVGDERKSSGNKNVEVENNDNSNITNQNSQNTESQKQDSSNVNSENSNIKNENSGNTNTQTPKMDSGNVKKTRIRRKKDKNENTANSNSSDKL